MGNKSPLKWWRNISYKEDKFRPNQYVWRGVRVVVGTYLVNVHIIKTYLVNIHILRIFNSKKICPKKAITISFSFENKNDFLKNLNTYY
jgi:hypothetical protein